MAKRQGLGRGLGALLGEKPEDVMLSDGKPALRDVDIAQVKPNPDQPRKDFSEAELEELADSIRECGILQPLVVRPHEGAYQIVAGERRYQAARRAGLATVPCVIREVDDADVMQLALVENLQREDLNPLEAAFGYRSLMEEGGLTQEEVGKAVGKSRPAVSNTLRLLELPDEVQQLLRDGALSAGHARAILRVEGDDPRCALARKVVAEGLSVRQTEILAPLFFVKNGEEAPKREKAPKSYIRAARKLRASLGTKVRVHTVRGKSKIEIEFADEDELDALTQRILGTGNNDMGRQS